ncbi:MAG: ADP-forming succinate--CoA ligase subunit beta [Candidatus Thalassarchaeaceae archaeon]|nr:ADP-forming succinate--CoA ligase subunit beta [Candidatus Thalassarchaeaceae archaeon]
MNIHEYQGKALFREAGLTVQDGYHCTSVEQALDAYDALGGNVVAVKSQIHAGGRGKGSLFCPDSGDLMMEGGVKIAFSREDVQQFAENILGNVLVTKQTGPEGKTVNNLYVEGGCKISHEYYLAILIDREEKVPLIMASCEGGMDIEEVAEKTPEAIFKVNVDPQIGLEAEQAKSLADSLNLSGTAANSFIENLTGLFNFFVSNDCAMVEINPMVRTEDDQIVLLDAKVGFDDNALFRHPEIFELRDISEEEPTEVRAKAAGLSYVKLDGDIGCLVNGAGLAMATMDVIKLYGGEPANFLDVGGGANEEQVTTAFGIIMEDPNVKGILVNIFGGIMRCDIIARGVIAATEALALEDPLVVRLVGTNFEEGRRILAESGLNIHTAETLAEGAQMIVELVGGGN